MLVRRVINARVCVCVCVCVCVIGKQAVDGCNDGTNWVQRASDCATDRHTAPDWRTTPSHDHAAVVTGRWYSVETHWTTRLRRRPGNSHTDMQTLTENTLDDTVSLWPWPFYLSVMPWSIILPIVVSIAQSGFPSERGHVHTKSQLHYPVLLVCEIVNYVAKSWFIFPPHLTNASALPC